MPASQAASYYGPGSSVGDPEYRQDYQNPHQPQNVGWKADQQYQNQTPNVPVSPPPSYNGHGYEYGNGAVPAHGQQPQPPLQVYAHHGNGAYPQGPPGVYEQHGQGYYAPSPVPSPAPGKHKRDRKDHKYSHGHGEGSGSGKYPRPGGEAPQQQVEVVYVERKKKGKDGFAWGCCAGCTAACCCCGCSVM